MSTAPRRDPFTSAEARAAGYTAQQIRDRVVAGTWVVLRYGVLCTSQRLAEADDVRKRHALEIAAAQLTVRRPTAASGWSAAFLWGLPLPGRLAGKPPDRITLTAETGRARRRLGIDVHRGPLDEDQVDCCLGVHLTSPARTALDLALRGTDADHADVLAVLDAVLHRGWSTVARLASIADQFDGWPGARRARELIGSADPRAESPLESHSRVFFDEYGIPVPETQVEIFDRTGLFVARVDFRWHDWNAVGEADGRVKYTSGEVLMAEKRREDRLRELGYEVVRWDIADLRDRPVQTAERIFAALSRGARRSH